MTLRAGEHQVFFGLGSNLGEREANLRRGLELLEAGGVRLWACSSLYRTAPWGGVEQPDFYNLAAAGATEMEPLPLLELAKAAEAAAGRMPGVRWGPRVLDIDILLYDELTFAAPGLIIPHKELYRRAFALAPLLEIAPQAQIPGQSQPAAELLAGLPLAERQGVELAGGPIWHKENLA